tara:strand:+ start:770 stop:1003 length:234 start_codon:yes stop_codon:yes gene_type:complete
MIENFDINTKKMVQFLSELKEKELVQCKDKIVQLKRMLVQNPNDSVNEYKYQLAQIRYDQLKRTTKGLKQLESGWKL